MFNEINIPDACITIKKEINLSLSSVTLKLQKYDSYSKMSVFKYIMHAMYKYIKYLKSNENITLTLTHLIDGQKIATKGENAFNITIEKKKGSINTTFNGKPTNSFDNIITETTLK